jgi:hypothetical protein
LPDRKDLRDLSKKLEDGWFVNTNLNNVLQKTLWGLTAEVVGLKFGNDLVGF